MGLTQGKLQGEEAIGEGLATVEGGTQHAGFGGTVRQEPHELVWKADALRAVAANGLAIGPWWDAAAAVKGWRWVRLAADPFVDWDKSAVGSRGKGGEFVCGEFDGDGRLDSFGLTVDATGWYCGGFREGKRSGKGIYEAKDGSRYEGDWFDGMMHGRGIKVYPGPMVYMYDGEWAESLWHGRGVLIYHNGRHCCAGTWEKDLRQGAFRSSTCACFDDAPDFAKQREHHLNAPWSCRPFGFLTEGEYRNDMRHGHRKITWCNGDTADELFKENMLIEMRFTMSPECPDERFRGRVIEGVRWRTPLVTRADESLTYTLEQPDPTEAPQAFRLYREYYEQGHLPVEDRDRGDISALLAEAAKELAPGE